jgi:hypothetical protein
MEQRRKELLGRLDRIKADHSLSFEEKFQRTVAEILALPNEDPK